MNEKKHILVVDDDKRIRKLIQKYLRKNNYLVSTASNASEALSYTALIDFDLFILDVMMPGEDGLSLTKKLLNKYFTPIILLTARKETSDRIIGLETGADDYISKPFEPRELILRIESIFKRIKNFDEKKSIKDISIGILKFDCKRQELWNGDYLIVAGDFSDNKKCVNIFKFNSTTTPESFEHQKQIFQIGNHTSGRFGRANYINNNYALVSNEYNAASSQTGTYPGEYYIYKREGTDWIYQDTIAYDSDAGRSYFSRSLLIEAS